MTRNAKAEHDGFLWAMDHGIDVDNLIFYGHRGEFCFGWRHPLATDLASRLFDLISEFSYPYEIKCADGRTLSGNKG